MVIRTHWPLLTRSDIADVTDPPQTFTYWLYILLFVPSLLLSLKTGSLLPSCGLNAACMNKPKPYSEMFFFTWYFMLFTFLCECFCTYSQVNILIRILLLFSSNSSSNVGCFKIRISK